MALPVTISGASFPPQNYFCGPLKAPNQQFYVVLRETGGSTIEVFMATDPEVSFAAQDAANNPATSANGIWVYLSGSEIHIATVKSAGSIKLQYHVFDTASDTWTIVDETIDDIKDPPVVQDLSASVALRSDGDVIVLYNGDQDDDMGNPFERVDYARREGGSWTVGIDVGGTSPGGEDRLGSVVVRGSADNMHFFWTHPAQTSELRGRSLDSANNLSTTRTSNEMTTPIIHAFVPGIYWDDAGTKRVAVLFHDADTDELKVSRWTETAGSLDAIIGTTLVGGPQDVALKNNTPIACLAVDGDGKIFAVWSGGGAAGVDEDLYRDDAVPPYTTWPGETLITTSTFERVSCNVYPRDGAIKLAFVYSEAGTIKYNEVSISAPTAPTMADSRFPDQNYKIGPYSI